MRATTLGRLVPFVYELRNAIDDGDYLCASDIVLRMAALPPDQAGGLPPEYLLATSNGLTNGFGADARLGAMFERCEFIGPDGTFVVVGEIALDDARGGAVLSMLAGRVVAPLNVSRQSLSAVRHTPAGFLPSIVISGRLLVIQSYACAGAIPAHDGHVFIPANRWRFLNSFRGPTFVEGVPHGPTIEPPKTVHRYAERLLRSSTRLNVQPTTPPISTRRPALFDIDYHLPDGIDVQKARWRHTSLWRSVVTALRDITAIPLLVMAHSLLASGVSPAFALPVWLLAYPVTLLLIARQFRALEALVHEAAHRNWTRTRKTNDSVANVLAAMPVIQSVEAFRKSHQVHHDHLGGDEDPCQRRFHILWARLRRDSALRYGMEMARVMGTYAASWWRLVGSDMRILRAALIWHLGVFILPGAYALMLAGAAPSATAALATSVTLWLRYVLVSFVVVLPVLRFIAEAAKHDYAKGTTTREGTFSNVGPIHWLLHPNGDAYHFLHHVAPWIVHHQARHAHHWLNVNDPHYAESRMRHSVLEDPAMPSRPSRIRPRRARLTAVVARELEATSAPRPSMERSSKTEAE